MKNLCARQRDYKKNENQTKFLKGGSANTSMVGWKVFKLNACNGKW